MVSDLLYFRISEDYIVVQKGYGNPIAVIDLSHSNDPDLNLVSFSSGALEPEDKEVLEIQNWIESYFGKDINVLFSY